MINGQLFKGFSKLSREQRFQRLQDMGALTAEDIAFLNQGGVQSLNLAEDLVENVIGYMQIPLGVAANLHIDGRDVAVPMAVEETSIIAAVSKTAKWIREQGSITTEVVGDCIIGQIQCHHVEDAQAFRDTINNNAEFLIEAANENVASGLVRRGGGVRNISVREVVNNAEHTMMVIHVFADPCDAMGANIMNQICEYLKTPIENLTQTPVTMCILSNLNDSKLTRACVRLNNIDPALAEKIEQASIFAENDPYRATTHNKGILNGVDPILLATGNDWRAVEAGMHAFACRDGQYRSLTTWRRDGNDLVGELLAPIIVGTVGGVTKLHPTAQLSLRMLGVTEANELSRIIAAVGLVQNLGALTALVTVGIIDGHMRLHISNLSLSAGATEAERPLLQQRLENLLQQHKRLSLQHAITELASMRHESPA